MRAYRVGKRVVMEKCQACFRMKLSSRVVLLDLFSAEERRLLADRRARTTNCGADGFYGYCEGSPALVTTNWP